MIRHWTELWIRFYYRITDLQCALGLSQLKKLDWFRRRRREIVQRYNEAFSGVTWGVTPFEESWSDSNFYLYVFRFDFARIGKSRTDVMGLLKGRGIQTQVHYIPVFSHPFYSEHFPVDEAWFPHTGQFYESCLSLPLFPGMSDVDVETVIREVHALADIMKNRSSILRDLDWEPCNSGWTMAFPTSVVGYRKNRRHKFCPLPNAGGSPCLTPPPVMGMANAFSVA